MKLAMKLMLMFFFGIVSAALYFDGNYAGQWLITICAGFIAFCEGVLDIIKSCKQQGK